MKYSAIDLDSLGFIVAYHQFIKLENLVDENKVFNHVKDFIDSIVQATEANKYALFYQAPDSRVFRYDVFKDYKAHRPEAPDFLKHWGSFIRECFKELNATALTYIESDDALAILHKEFNHKDNELTLCHNDKDMFQLFGRHYMYKSVKFVEITIEEARKNLYSQILMGDSTDNIQGCKGIGPKTADKLLSVSDNYIKTCLEEYKKIYGPTYKLEYMKNRKLVKLLDPNQTSEKFDVNWQTNTNLVTISSLFESDTVDSLFE